MAKPSPSLHFKSNKNHNVTNFTLECTPNFRLNSKTKHPSNTTHNVSIKDTIQITGNGLKDCEMFLKLDDGSEHGLSISSSYFRLLDENHNNIKTTINNKNNNLYQASIEIPPSINQKKGNGSSRVGFIELYNPNKEFIAASDKFWIRSRSRQQMAKDEKTKKRGRSISNNNNNGLLDVPISSTDSDEGTNSYNSSSYSPPSKKISLLTSSPLQQQQQGLSILASATAATVANPFHSVVLNHHTTSEKYSTVNNQKKSSPLITDLFNTNANHANDDIHNYKLPTIDSLLHITDNDDIAKINNNTTTNHTLSLDGTSSSKTIPNIQQLEGEQQQEGTINNKTNRLLQMEESLREQQIRIVELHELIEKNTKQINEMQRQLQSLL